MNKISTRIDKQTWPITVVSRIWLDFHHIDIEERKWFGGFPQGTTFVMLGACLAPACGARLARMIFYVMTPDGMACAQSHEVSRSVEEKFYEWFGVVS
jgi:hypothetical protein